MSLRLRAISFVCIAITMLWAALSFFVMSNVPVSLQFVAGQQENVSAVAIDYDGVAHDLDESRRLSAEGIASFRIPADGASFGFRFGKNKDGYAFLGLSVLGIKLLDGAQAARFNMREKIFNDYPNDKDKPLLLQPKGDAVFELTNVFPYMLKVWRAVRCFVAFGPVVLVALFLIWLIVGHRLTFFLSDILDADLVFYLILAGVILLTLPPPVNPVLPGLDSSWEWLFSHYAFTGAIGRDFVFTYGPLGFLIKPQDALGNVLAGLAVNTGFLIAFGFEMVLLYRAGRRTAMRGAAFAIMAMWLLEWPNGMEWKWCAVSVVACALAVFMTTLRASTRYVLFVIAAVTATLQSFIKFSSCITALGEEIFLVTFYLAVIRHKAVYGVIAYFGAVVFCALIGSMLLFPDFPAVCAWVKGSIEISSGYNFYMGNDRPSIDFVPSFLLVAVIGTQLFCGKERIKGFSFWMAFGPILFCTFKYAAVRQGTLPLALMAAVVAVLASVHVPSRSRFSLGIACVCILVGFGTDAIFRGMPLRLGLSVQNFIDSIRCANAFARVQRESHEERAVASLPFEWLQLIGTNKIMIAGWEMGPAMTGSLNLVPFPATQTYSAYTPYLDDLCARRVAEPDVMFVLAPADPLTIDSRNIYFDNPRLWRAVREHFLFVDGNNSHVLLQRRKEPVRCGDFDYEFGFRRTLVGRLLSFFWRTPQALAGITFDDGTFYCCTANPEVLDSALLPNVLPTVPSDVPVFFKTVDSSSSRKIQSIVIYPSCLLNQKYLLR